MPKQPAAIAAIIVAIIFLIVVSAVIFIPLSTEENKSTTKRWFNACAANCPADLIKVIQTNNPNIKLGLLFEHDGCSVYRFMDGEPLVYHYYMKCNKEIKEIQ